MNFLRRIGFFAIVFIFASSAYAQDSQRDSMVALMTRDSARIFEIIDQYYYTRVNHERCFREMVRTGDVSTCLDRYSHYFTSKAWTDQQNYLNSRYSGIGMTLVRRGNRIVVFPLPRGPAARAGILSGDVLIKIDSFSVVRDTEVTDRELQEFSSRIRGESGSMVLLTLERRGLLMPTIAVSRERITMPSVRYSLIFRRIGYIRIYFFSDHLFEEFFDAMESLRRAGANRFIFDLRNNPVGLLGQALNAAALFADSANIPLIAQQSREGQRLYFSTEPGVFRNIRPVILVNHYTASAAEIFSGILRDWGRAELVGRPTFGKGIGQTVIPISPMLDGSPLPGTPIMILTNFRYLIGTRRLSISEGNGLQPNYLVSEELSQEEAAALEIDMRDRDPNDLYLNPRFDKSLRRAIEISVSVSIDNLTRTIFDFLMLLP